MCTSIKVYHNLPIPNSISCLFKKKLYFAYGTQNVDLNVSVTSSKLYIRRYSPFINSVSKRNSMIREIRTNKTLRVLKQQLKLDLLSKYI